MTASAVFPRSILFLPGSLVDKNQRIETDNPIFSKLQRTILHPSRTKEWFGMAEQVVNAIYALAEHPDVLCNEVIKKLTDRAFNRPKNAAEGQGGKEDEKGADPDASMGENQPGDTTITEDDFNMDGTQPLATQVEEEVNQSKDLGDAFELAQLLFVVGHVAIKHIVFLELVEREWKRQKDENKSGWLFPFCRSCRCSKRRFFLKPRKTLVNRRMGRIRKRMMN